MGAQVLRVEKRAALGGPLAAHILGRSRPANALARPGLPAVEVLASDVDGAQATMRAALVRPRRGRPPALGVELLLAGPPPLDAPEAWPLERVREWARASFAWVQRCAPDAPIATAALHLDERSPHVHVLLGARVYEGDREVLGVNGVVRALGASSPRAPAPKRGPHRQAMSRAQDAYHEHVARRFDLERGSRRSTARHVDVDPLEGFRRRAEDLERRSALARRETERAEALATAASTRAEQLIEEGDRERARVDGLLDQVVSAEAGRDQARLAEAQAKGQRKHEEAALEALREEHRQLEAQYNAKRGELRRLERLGVEMQAERDRVAAELAELRQQAKGAREARQAAQQARDQALLDAAQSRKRAEDAEQAARAAREQREADEALGSRAVAGRTARRGRKLREAHEIQVTTLTSELQERTAERDAEREETRRWQAVAVATQRKCNRMRAERDELRKRVPDPQEAELSRLHWHEMQEREVGAARFLGIEQGLLIAGAALRRWAEAIRLPGLEPLWRALSSGNAGEVETAVSGLETRQRTAGRAQGASERSGGWER